MESATAEVTLNVMSMIDSAYLRRRHPSRRNFPIQIFSSFFSLSIGSFKVPWCNTLTGVAVAKSPAIYNNELSLL
ncbi:Uncharacterized protein HZ326_26827 [Fusarium oxysporum f. sp. albedinis]|nr:Uncharacterized protein HZ326_26827 [Fusarium oxysporum f. sp. albedinis]